MQPGRARDGTRILSVSPGTIDLQLGSTEDYAHAVILLLDATLRRDADEKLTVRRPNYTCPPHCATRAAPRSMPQCTAHGGVQHVRVAHARRLPAEANNALCQRLQHHARNTTQHHDTMQVLVDCRPRAGAPNIPVFKLLPLIQLMATAAS